ncbi:MAG: hypothetical protein LIO93_12695 [Bacteroidales bacterium]|nr:hypothetical protein [Bacteroidales bacterium]
MKRIFLIIGLGLIVNMLNARINTIDQNMEKVIALTEVFGDGQKVTAAILEYDKEIKNSSLSMDSYEVEGRTITKVYSNNSAKKTSEGTDGKYVIIELSPNDADALLFVQEGRKRVLKEAQLSVRQVKEIETTSNKRIQPIEEVVKNSSQMNLVVDDFVQREYTYEPTGDVLQYNLFIPQNYDTSKSYPLILFMHDASITGGDVLATLVQGNGAIIWATPEEQAKHPCFVLAPQFARQVVNDNSEASIDLDVTIGLIRSLMQEYNIDANRLYTTGQSGGCMMSIAMNIKYPDFFAASYLVAGQWDANLVTPMANDKLWILVSEGDSKAFPGMNAITAALEKEGARVSRAVWDGQSTPEIFEKEVRKMVAEDTNIKYTMLKLGTTLPESQRNGQKNEHMETWKIAYNIEGIRDWIFSQSKKKE